MSDIHLKIKKFSKFLTTKVKEKTQNVFSEEEDDEEEAEDTEEGRVITRRHSSYVKRSSIEDSIFINTTPFNIKEDVYHYHTISSATNNNYLTPSSPTTPVSALSPPPRQPKKVTITSNQRKSFSSFHQPCLSRSNTLGDYSNETPDTPPIPFSTVSPSTSTLSGRCNMNHVNTLIN